MVTDYYANGLVIEWYLRRLLCSVSFTFRFLFWVWLRLQYYSIWYFLFEFLQEDPNCSDYFKVKIKGQKRDVLVDFQQSKMIDGPASHKIKQVSTGSGSGSERKSVVHKNLKLSYRVTAIFWNICQDTLTVCKVNRAVVKTIWVSIWDISLLMWRL